MKLLLKNTFYANPVQELRFNEQRHFRISYVPKKIYFFGFIDKLGAKIAYHDGTLDFHQS